MKLLLTAIFDFFEDIGRARAASHLAHLGHYDAARQLMLNNQKDIAFEVHP